MSNYSCKNTELIFRGFQRYFSWVFKYLANHDEDKTCFYFFRYSLPLASKTCYAGLFARLPVNLLQIPATKFQGTCTSGKEFNRILSKFLTCKFLGLIITLCAYCSVVFAIKNFQIIFIMCMK